MERAGRPIKCRAAVAWAKTEPFTIETVEVAPPKHKEVRIKMASAGLCHSDLHFLEGVDPKLAFPCVLGHEGVGVVESVGEDVTDIQPGDFVIPLFEGYCGECKLCKSPKTNLCEMQPRNHLQMDGTSRISCKGSELSQLVGISTFSEYTVAPVNNLAKISSKADLKTVCLAGCSIPTGYGAVMNAAQVTPGSTCAIWGLGGIGMTIVMACKASGASKIIGIDVNPQKFPLAKELGCTDVLNAKEVPDVPKALAEMTGGGVDYCLVSVGSIPAMEQAYQSSHPAWGLTVIVGLVNFGETMKVDAMQLLFGKKVIGTYYGTKKAKLEVPELVDKIVSGEIELDKLISNRLPLDKINEGYQLMKDGKSIRAVIDFDL